MTSNSGDAKGSKAIIIWSIHARPMAQQEMNYGQVPVTTGQWETGLAIIVPWFYIQPLLYEVLHNVQATPITRN